MQLAELARTINDGQIDLAMHMIRQEIGDLQGLPVLVLGMTYRAGVKELAYSQGPALIERLRSATAEVSAYDPLLSEDEIRGLNATPWTWGSESSAVVVVAQTADPRWDTLDPAWMPALRMFLDGRNARRGGELPVGAVYMGFGIPPPRRNGH